VLLCGCVERYNPSCSTVYVNGSKLDDAYLTSEIAKMCNEVYGNRYNTEWNFMFSGGYSVEILINFDKFRIHSGYCFYDRKGNEVVTKIESGGLDVLNKLKQYNEIIKK
jgi:hypothetical protein